LTHDFNKILGAILALSDRARDQLDEQHPARRSIDEIVRTTERAGALAGKVTTFARSAPRHLQVLEANSFTEDWCPTLASLLGDHIELRLDLDEDVPPIEIDPQQFGRVLLNLCANARDAMPAGGELTIATEAVTIETEVLEEMPGLSPGDYLHLQVRDTGSGIASEVRERLFDPFFTTKGRGAGTGLGLSVVHGIVRQSGGEIFVDSEPGEGSTFHVYLPRHTGGADEAEEPSHAVAVHESEFERGDREREEIREAYRVLLVEDERILRSLLVRSLRERGYEVASASNFGDACEKLEEASAGFDVIVTDVHLPGEPIDTLLGAVRDSVSPPPVLFISGGLRPEFDSKIESELDLYFLQKPFLPSKLDETLKEIL
jgi:two-component system cell cycle sensor histidine kinase/response regulator CckA